VKGIIVRIDDRLVHGQVSAGWVEPLGIRRVVLANDAIAGDELERELYRTAVPEGVEFVAAGVAEAAALLAKPGPEPCIVLVESVGDALRLVEAGLAVQGINVGGVHSGAGRAEVLPFVYLTAEERAEVRALAAKGVKLEAKMLPHSEAWDLAELVGKQ
jgi:mannose/fructose/N-acetylgalactosamine-specific phosphotransferase system component IIB